MNFATITNSLQSRLDGVNRIQDKFDRGPRKSAGDNVAEKFFNIHCGVDPVLGDGV
jgi:hypothetical protein